MKYVIKAYFLEAKFYKEILDFYKNFSQFSSIF